MQPYRKQRCHALVLLGYDFALPVLVVALGCFFSVSTLVLLFQVRRGGASGLCCSIVPSLSTAIGRWWLPSAAPYWWPVTALAWCCYSRLAQCHVCWLKALLPLGGAARLPLNTHPAVHTHSRPPQAQKNGPS